MSIANSPFYRKCTKPVSLEDLKLGLHVGNAAVLEQFPMQPPSAHVIHIDDDTFTFGDNPFTRALLAMNKAFPDQQGSAIFSRLTAIQEMADAPGMAKWVIWHAEEKLEFADALMEVAATFPFRPGTFKFKLKPFLREVQRIADLKYGGKFS